MKVKVSLGHNFINLISDYSFLFPGMIKYPFYFVNVPQPEGIPGPLRQAQEQRDSWCGEAVLVLIRSSVGNDCPLLANSTLMKGQKAQQPPSASPR